ncbi:MAG: IS605 OrfB-like transposable element containing RNAse H-like and Zn finger domain [Candidatus Methanohalarchaeum thermophilum]|uniref:IS605 OrfB-like transposable element containing RNAse H-like and Zn finger domain n=1 Tax=Methanohalarchaeum thermophilum TaxID=1903181 RepID=A0A1Q6DUE3_METT1|nr:MAG: IS605 OrfB-like transposable element containing RNAse H-like and Zn finger domain [Candidatus Methanohalarchaeum thermophilum]
MFGVSLFLWLFIKLCELVGKYVEVEARDTAKSCSNLNCGNKVDKELSDRTRKRKECGLEIDRGLNASINIVNKAINLVGQGLFEVKALGHIDVCWNFGSSKSCG